MISAYSLGKAQRILAGLNMAIGPILTDPAVHATNAVLRAQGIPLPATTALTPATDPADHPHALILGTSANSPLLQGFPHPTTAFASGWTRLRRRPSGDRGFVISDHADWAGLNSAIAATGASRVYVTHGYTAPFRRWLETRGYDARILGADPTA